MAITDNINIDFQVFSTGDPKLLAIFDTSVWGLIENKPAIIEIVVPGTTVPIVYDFEKSKSNVFNSSNLLISPIGQYKDLADGIYRITVKGSPDTNCRHKDFLKTDKIRLELYKIYCDLGTDNDREETINVKKIIQDIELFIRASEALVSRGKLKKGFHFLKTAMEKINDYNDCKNNCK